MTSENIGVWVMTSTGLKSATIVSGEAGSSGSRGEAPDDGEEAGPGGAGGLRTSDGGGAGSGWGGAGPSWAGTAGPSGSGGPSWAADAGPSGSGGPNWAADTGPSGSGGPSWAAEPGPSGVPSQYARGEGKNKQDNRDSRRKRKSKNSTGEVSAKKIKTGAAEGPDKEPAFWRSDGSMNYYHRLFKKQKKRKLKKDDKERENTSGSGKRALKRKRESKEAHSTEAVVVPERECNNNKSSFMRTRKPPTVPPSFIHNNLASPSNSGAQNAKVQNISPPKLLNSENPYLAEGNDDSSIAELLNGMNVHGLGDANNAASRRSKFNHQRVVWWTTAHWYAARNEAEYEDGTVGMASSSHNANENGADGTSRDSVPDAPVLDEPMEMVHFDPNEARNAVRARLSREKRQRRLAVSESDIDVDNAHEEFHEFLLIREGSEDSSDSSDVTYSPPPDPDTDSSDSSSDESDGETTE